MTKELSDLAWRILPAEFKEEVKELYEHENEVIVPISGVTTLNEIFGFHNLTSDAEGEDEMLYVSRKEVQELYKGFCVERDNEEKGSVNRFSLSARIAMLEELFGSKCLPDEVGNEVNFASKEPKPAEPKYHVGQRMRCLNDGETYIVLAKVGKHHYSLQGVEHDVHEDYLEPYTEPTAAFTDDCKSQCKSQNQFRDPAKMVIQPETSEPTFIMLPRLKIAAMAMQGMLSNTTRFSSYEISDLVRISLNCADALIAECEKGGEK